MAKFLLVVKSQDQLNVNTAVNVAQGLKMMGADDVKMVFLGPGITALNKKNDVSQIVNKAQENLKKMNITVYACEMAMKNYNVNKEDLIYFNEISKGADVIVKFANEGYQILTF
ncbi:DsrE family protein [Sulfurisphaera javensis]|uniref:DsrE family protein n=1 Tax=Sulfurisphaera javensis TaxID=2049879 RepID=A0AAT9GNI2_9CREN